MPKPNGAQIRRRRQERGLTTAELAARVGFTNEGSMRNIENRNDPTAMIKLYRIARELGVAVDEIIAVGDAGSPNTPADGEPPSQEPHGNDRHGRVQTVPRTRLPAPSGDRW
jgi:transcriptional regulator with XRE-family HTH domain